MFLSFFCYLLWCAWEFVVWGGGLLSLWLYKENNKLLDWKNVFTLHIPPWAPQTYDFIVLTSLTHPRKILLVVPQIGKVKDLSTALRIPEINEIFLSFLQYLGDFHDATGFLIMFLRFFCNVYDVRWVFVRMFGSWGGCRCSFVTRTHHSFLTFTWNTNTYMYIHCRVSVL
jgi:hypothetical protein